MKLKITIWCEDEDLKRNKEDMLNWVKNTFDNEGKIIVNQVEVEESEFKDNKE